MKKRDELCSALDKKLKWIASDRKAIADYTVKLNKDYDLTVEIANDYLTLRNNISEANDFIIFMYTSLLYEDKLKEYFSTSEIKEYSQSKFKVRKLKFPLEYKMIQIAEDQWIGKITVKDLMLLRDAQVINYNEKAQRTMQRIVANGIEYYRIALNQSAVTGIESSLKNGTYIPNTLTLNLPEDAEFSFDEEDEKLIIKKTNNFHFDILDGYHRYVAISKAYNLNRSFDYDMELRIVQFNEDRAKQFIWQEDQKTKMRRIDSDAMNQTSIATKVITRLNGDPTFNLAGQINPNEGIVNSPLMYVCVNTLFCSNRIKKTEELPLIISTTNKLRETINYITEKDKKYLSKWDRRRIIAVTYAIYKDIPLKEILKEIEIYYDILCEHSDLLSVTRNAAYSKKDFARLDTFRAERG